MEIQYTRSAEADLADIAAVGGDAEGIFQWVDDYLTVFPFIGPAFDPPDEEFRFFVIDGRWRITWTVVQDDLGGVTGVVIGRVTAAVSSQRPQ